MSSSTLLDDAPIKDLLNLKLKKPKSWNWELSTSKSSSSINFPRIRLYDHRNNLLAEADESDQLVNNTNHSQQHNPSSSASSQKPINRLKAESFRQHVDVGRSHTRSVSRSKTTDMSDFLDEIRKEMLDQGFKCKVTERGRSSSRKRIDSGNVVDEIATLTPQAPTIENKEAIQIEPRPIIVFSERGPLQRDQNAKEFKKPNDEIKATLPLKSALENNQISKTKASINNSILPDEDSISQLIPTVNYSMAKSKSAADVAGKKKMYRRTHSTNSPSRFSSSILERFSVTKRRSSSTDSEAGHNEEDHHHHQHQQLDDITLGFQQPPNYITRTCPAGTLIVCKDSFKTQRGRRRNASTPRRSTTQEPTDIKQLMMQNPQHSLLMAKSTAISYDKAIENIDNLISRAISSSSSAHLSPGNDVLRGHNIVAPPTKPFAKVEPLSTVVVCLPSSSPNELSTHQPSDETPGRNHNFEATSDEINVGSSRKAARHPTRSRKKADWQKVHCDDGNDLIVGSRDKRNGGGRRRRSASADSERFRLASSSSSSSDDDEERVNGKTSAAQQVVDGWAKCSNRRGRERTRRPATPLNSRIREAKDEGELLKGEFI